VKNALRPISLATLLLCAALLSPARSAPVGGPAICPLPDADVKRAVTEFSKMYQVFQDKRCVNCHGAVNPFGKDGSHAGGEIKLDNILKRLLGDRGALTEQLSKDLPAGEKLSGAAVSNAEAAIKTYFSAEPPLTDPQAIADILKEGGLDSVYRTVCAECHTNSPAPWQLATSPFAGKSAEALCESFQKRMDPSDFLGHVTNDNLGFIQAGFKGTRGLNPFGVAYYTSEIKRPYVLEPVRAMSQDALTKAANEWIGALGDTFHEPASCGCKETHYQLNVKLDYASHAVQGKAEADSAVSQHFATDLNFAKPDTFTADAKVPFKMSIETGMAGGAPGMPGVPGGPAGMPGKPGTPAAPGMPPDMSALAGSPIHCASQLNSTDTWHITGKIQESTDKGKQVPNTVKISAQVTKKKEPTEVVCMAYGRTIKVPGAPGAVEQDSTAGYDMIIPAVVGDPQKFNFNTPSGKMVVELEIVQH
jgi:mono/diheme cytochrome c family protein